MNIKRKLLGFLLVVILIIIGGVWWYLTQAGAQPQLEERQQENQQKATDTSSRSVGSVDSSDWQTYRNEEYGFELQYPETWEEAEEAPQLLYNTFASFMKEEGIVFGVFAVFTKFPLEEFFSYSGNYYPHYFGLPLAPEKAKQVEIQGRQAFLYSLPSDPAGNHILYAFKEKNILYFFYFPGISGEVSESVLSSVRFFEKEDLSQRIDMGKWQMYTDNPWGSNNFLGGSGVPDWKLSLQLPSSLRVLNVQEGEDALRPVELDLYVLFYGGLEKEKQKRIIEEYQKMGINAIELSRNGAMAMKVKNLTALDGCLGPQIYEEYFFTVSYKTFCVLGEDLGTHTFVLELVADRQDGILLESLKPVYDEIISSFRYEAEWPASL